MTVLCCDVVKADDHITWLDAITFFANQADLARHRGRGRRTGVAECSGVGGGWVCVGNNGGVWDRLRYSFCLQAQCKRNDRGDMGLGSKDVNRDTGFT